MKNFILNPSVTSFDLAITLDIHQLETEGWDFETYHKNRADVQQIELDEAKQRNYNEYNAIIRLTDHHEGGVGTMVSWFNYDKNEETSSEETGDDEQTIKDIIGFLSEKTLVIDETKDFSTNEQGEYVPTFILA